MIVTKAGVNKHREKERIIDVNFLANEYILHFFKTATLFYIGDKEVTSKANTVIIHNINHPRKFKTLDSEMENDYVCFYTDAADLEGIPFGTPIPVEDVEFFHNILTLIYNEVYNPGERSQETSEYLMKALLAKTKETYEFYSKKSAPVKQLQDLMHLRNLIQAYPRENWTIEKMAEECSISPSRFYVIYKKQFGITPMNDVIRARMNMAKRLLLTSTLSVKNVAGYCGYNSISHFINHFKKETGVTPSKYKDDI